MQHELFIFEVSWKGKMLQTEATPVREACMKGKCNQFELTLNNEPAGIIRKLKGGWKPEGFDDKKLLKIIGSVLDEAEK